MVTFPWRGLVTWSLAPLERLGHMVTCSLREVWSRGHLLPQLLVLTTGWNYCDGQCASPDYVL